MKVIFVRHGETSANKKQISQGHKDVLLNRIGLAQAKKVGLRLRNERIDRIYVSDLKRAVRTAKEIIRYHPESEIIYDSALRERNFGIYEGKPWGSTQKAADKKGVHYTKFKPKGGESHNEFTKRLRKFMNKELREEKGKTIAIVSHGGVIKRSIMMLMRIPDKRHEEVRVGNTSVSIVQIKANKKHKLHLLNCEKHLE